MVFNERRATDAAAHILKLCGGRMSYMKLIKLMYLADREALKQHGHTISTDSFVSMDRGPVLSQVLNLITSEPSPEELLSPWHQVISGPQDYEIELLADTSFGQLSPNTESVLDAVYAQFGHWDRWQLVKYTHALPEWRDPRGSSIPITIEEILMHQGVPQESIRIILGQTAAMDHMDEFISRFENSAESK